jgi:hypothetical protein
MNRRLTFLLAGVALVSASCASTPREKHDIGISRVGLTLAFSDKALQDAPVPPRIIIQLIPFDGSAADLSQYLIRPGQSVAIPNPFACATAPPDAAVPASAPFMISHAPQPGYYRLRNQGTIKITADGFTFGLPYPPISTMQVTNVKTTKAQGLLPTNKTVTTFDAITTLAKNFVTQDTYQLTGSEIDVLHHSEINSEGTLDDSWTPPVKVYGDGGPNTSWESIGVDLANKNALGAQAAVTKTKVIDACGSLIETVEVKSTTTIADLAHIRTSGTTPGKSDLIDYATSLGGIVAARSTHTTDVLTVNNNPVTIVTDVTSTLMSLTPTDTP